MGRLFCYTLSARAIGATVSAGALHAQGWGFESLIAHHLFDNGSRKGTVFVWAPRRGIRTRQGAEPRKREAFSSAAREERSDEAEVGGEAARDIPHRPPLNWKRSSKGDRFCLGPSQRDSNPPGCGAEETRKRFPAQHARAEGPKRERAAKYVLGECPCAKNAKYEYCYHFSSRVFKAPEGKSDIKTATDGPDG